MRPGVTTANQSSTYYNYTADRAVDGEPSRLSLLSESCSHTDTSQKEAWMTIDLGRVYNVKHVKFWYRNDREFFKSICFLFCLNVCIFVLTFEISFRPMQIEADTKKRSIGHIAHLINQFKSINTYDYVITLMKRKKTHY